MLLKVVHYIVLLCYLNILAYQPEVGIAAHQQDSILNGESLLEFVLDDVLNLPIDQEAEDVDILYDKYRTFESQGAALSLFVFVLALLFSFKQFVSYIKHPVYDGKKRQIIPGYYTHLYRLQTF